MNRWRPHDAGSASPTRQLRFARIAMVVQAAALAVLIGESIPQYLDYVLHPSTCTPDGWCMDLRGLEFELSVIFLGPPLLLLLVTSWLWRRPRRWPAVLPTVVDIAFIGLVRLSRSESTRPKPTRSCPGGIGLVSCRR